MNGPGVSTTIVDFSGSTGDTERSIVDQLDRVVVDAADAQAVERGREHALGDQPVLDHVRDARGRAQVVLQHAQHAVGAADQIDARDVDAHAARAA